MGLRQDKQQPRVSAPEMVDESLEETGDFEWKPNTQQLMVMVVLSIISFMVSLDATIIVTSLSVRKPCSFCSSVFCTVQVEPHTHHIVEFIVYR